jgi:sugar phosphate isomerase/epimerase
VDDGDVTHPEHGREEQRWLSTWLDVAEQLGTPRVRVPAGDQPPSEETLALSARRLRELAAEHPDLRLLTENWRGLLVDEVSTTRLLDLVEGEVGLLIDTGNWDGEDKYRQIGAVAGRAECSQVKVRESAPGVLDEADLEQSLAALAEAGYAGRLSLVYAGSDDDEWGRLAQMQEVLRRVLA